MTDLAVKELLVQARALIEAKWAQGYLYKEKTGGVCAIGALNIAGGEIGADGEIAKDLANRREAEALLAESIPQHKLDGSGRQGMVNQNKIINFNDHTNKKGVLGMFARAIDKVDARMTSRKEARADKREKLHV